VKSGPFKRVFDAAELKREFPGLADDRLHYLDNAATAQMPRAALDILHRFEVEARANVHESLYARARAATESYGEARSSIARFLGANSEEEVVFTSGTTSAINLLAHSFGALLAPGDEVMLSALEHHSNLVPWQQLAMRRGVVLRFLPMTPDGRLDLEALASELTERCRLVALTHCSDACGQRTGSLSLISSWHFHLNRSRPSWPTAGFRNHIDRCAIQGRADTDDDGEHQDLDAGGNDVAEDPLGQKGRLAEEAEGDVCRRRREPCARHVRAGEEERFLQAHPELAKEPVAVMLEHSLDP
jgi:hypothetical protein